MQDNTYIQARLFVSATAFVDEKQTINDLKEKAFPESVNTPIRERARGFIQAMRRARYGNMIEAFLQKYTLDSREGVLLMMLAEALLRIPDHATQDAFIAEKITSGSWWKHLSWRNIPIVNGATLGLMLASVCLKVPLVRTLIKPLLRKSMKRIIHFLGRQFVMSSTLMEALIKTRNHEKTGHMRYSYDMLGEAARTQEDAQKYFEAYREAIISVGHVMNNVFGPLAEDASLELMMKRSGISIKLSALHPRYETNQKEALMREMMPRLISLLELAREYGIGVTLDAEESYRLDIMLEIFEAAKLNQSMKWWSGLGLVVQAYLKNAPHTIAYLKQLAQVTKTLIPIRLVKGAYWDSEIKHAQELGLKDYPVYTRKKHTDAAYLDLAKTILESRQFFFPQFATHNAYTLSALLEFTKNLPGSAFEFQKLHGMGDDTYTILKKTRRDKKIFVRTYAPVGSYKDLLPYLVRRFLENGASTSFIPLVYKKNIAVDRLAQDPFAEIKKEKLAYGLSLPHYIYGDRLNSRGVELNNKYELSALQEGVTAALSKPIWQAYSIVKGKPLKNGEPLQIKCPWNVQTTFGQVWEATDHDVDEAFHVATTLFENWNTTPVQERASLLRKTADLYEENYYELIALAVQEGGKTLDDCIAEVREAVDFLRYYAQQAEEKMAHPVMLPGPTGERNELILEGRGLFVCISPWNFPLAIFTGQIAAALATGNCVLAKAAEQTPMIATYAVQLFEKAGIPSGVLNLLIGKGETIGARLTKDKRVDGVVFTGSVETAHTINQTLAQKKGPIVPLIAETGGQNAMIVDSSALPEHVVNDVLISAFKSAGQRCSALRVLFIQREASEKLLPMLTQAIADLKVGNPMDPAIDVGPIIDAQALTKLEAHKIYMEGKGKLLAQAPLDPTLKEKGYFFAPCIYAIPSLEVLPDEVFGPCLHIIIYDKENIDHVIEQINHTGYGLTLGIQSRLDAFKKYIKRKTRIGNSYEDRTMIGAVVGTQPFGGRGLSGTGPKAGGPHYLLRFVLERVETKNLTVIGGNTELLMSAQNG